MLRMNIDLGIYRAFMDNISEGHWALGEGEKRKIECNDALRRQQVHPLGQDTSTSVDLSGDYVTQVQQFVPDADADEQAARHAFR